MLNSPISYMGSKRRLLNQILPYFPKDINTFYDLFAGGGAVSLNTPAKTVVWNDLEAPLVNMFSALATLTPLHIQIIKGELLEMCVSKDKFIALRDKYNANNQDIYDRSLTLYKLITLSFNNTPRFNSNGEYNMPYGKSRVDRESYINKKIKDLIKFVDYTQNHDFMWGTMSYQQVIKQDYVKPGDFVYLDPPYSLTDATYMKSNSWTEDQDMELWEYLERLDAMGLKFAMSNVLSHRGKVNQTLTDLASAGEFKVVHLNMDYSNSTYHTKNGKSDEVLIMNY